MITIINVNGVIIVIQLEIFMQFFKNFYHLLVHDCSLHLCVSDATEPSEVQSSPPTSGAGLSQIRVLP